MKAKLAIVLGVLGATVLLVVLMTVSPNQTPVPAQQPVGPKPQEPVPAATPGKTQASAAEPATAVPAPFARAEDLAAIEERIESSVDRLPALERMKLWMSYPSPKMSDEDYEKARGLFLRFLGNFARIETARFHVETCEVTSDGKTLSYSEDIVWSSSKWSLPKYRVETSYGDGKTREVLTICDGKNASHWREGQMIHKGPIRLWRGWPSNYFYGSEMAMLRERRPYFLNVYTDCEIDDGTAGCSRVWRQGGREARFDTDTGLLTEYRFDSGGTSTNTYQRVDGLWFPLETIRALPGDPEENQEAGTTREVFSQVVLNEPVDEALFDVNNPG